MLLKRIEGVAFLSWSYIISHLKPKDSVMCGRIKVLLEIVVRARIPLPSLAHDLPLDHLICACIEFPSNQIQHALQSLSLLINALIFSWFLR